MRDSSAPIELSSINSDPFHPSNMINLVEWVGSSAPVGEEQAETDGFEEAGKDTNSDSVDRSVLSNEGRDELVTVSLGWKIVLDQDIPKGCMRQRRRDHRGRQLLCSSEYR